MKAVASKSIRNASKNSDGSGGLSWVLVAGLVALVFYLLESKGASAPSLHGASHVSWYQPDLNTGVPQFSSGDAGSVPPGTGLPALLDPGTNAVILQAPSGYTTWKDIATGNFYYYPDSTMGVLS